MNTEQPGAQSVRATNRFDAVGAVPHAKRRTYVPETASSGDSIGWSLDGSQNPSGPLAHFATPAHRFPRRSVPGYVATQSVKYPVAFPGTSATTFVPGSAAKTRYGALDAAMRPDVAVHLSLNSSSPVF